MLCRIGFLMVVIGIMAADSDCLLVPAALVGVGTLLLWKGGAFEGREEIQDVQDQDQ